MACKDYKTTEFASLLQSPTSQLAYCIMNNTLVNCNALCNDKMDWYLEVHDFSHTSYSSQPYVHVVCHQILFCQVGTQDSFKKISKKQCLD